MAEVEFTEAERDRFWSKTAPIPYCGCILWTAGVDKDGYGKFQVTNRGDGPKQHHWRAHRFALAMKLGRKPRGLALHACDVPACVNPDHLSEGTQRENIAQCIRRGRKPVTRPPRRTRDSGHHRAKLTTAQVEALRARRLGGERVKDLAAAAGVHPATLSKLLGRTRGAHA